MYRCTHFAQNLLMYCTLHDCTARHSLPAPAQAPSPLCFQNNCKCRTFFFPWDIFNCRPGPGWICFGFPSALCREQQQSRCVWQSVWSPLAWAGWCSSGHCWVEIASSTTRSLLPSTARRASRTSASVVTLLPWHIPLPLVAAFMSSKKISCLIKFLSKFSVFQTIKPFLWI